MGRRCTADLPVRGAPARRGGRAARGRRPVRARRGRPAARGAWVVLRDQPAPRYRPDLAGRPHLARLELLAGPVDLVDLELPARLVVPAIPRAPAARALPERLAVQPDLARPGCRPARRPRRRPYARRHSL